MNPTPTRAPLTGVHVLHVAPDDLDPVVAILNQAAARLVARGVTGQWPADFHADGGKRIVKLREHAGRGEVYLLGVGDRYAATLTLTRTPDPDFTPYWPRGTASSALYMCRWAVADGFTGRGAGAALLDFADTVARRERVDWLRADCSRANTALHDLYRSRGFRHMGTPIVAGRLSGALWQRDVPR